MPVRTTQGVVASLSAGGLAHTQASQVVVAALSLAGAAARATTFDLTALVVDTVRVRASWIAIEVLCWRGGPYFDEETMPAVYPALPGLAYSVIKRPMFFTGQGLAASGREVRVGYAQNPLWEWDLTYDWLPDKPGGAAATPSDLKQLIGFYLSQGGSLGGFQFADPDDNAVTGQVIGITDGVTTNWTLVRSYGGSDGVGTEPIGTVNTGVAFNVYLNGVLQTLTTDYTLVTTQPVAQVLKFNAAPAADQVITVDMSYYYYCRFKDDHYDFEKFMDKLWSQRLITLRSLRG